MSACPPLPVLEQDIKLRTSVLYIQAALKYFQVTILRHGRTFPWSFGHTNGSGQNFVHGRTTRNVYDLVRSVVTPRSITCNPCTFQTPIKKLTDLIIYNRSESVVRFSRSEYVFEVLEKCWLLPK